MPIAAENIRTNRGSFYRNSNDHPLVSVVVPRQSTKFLVLCPQPC